MIFNPVIVNHSIPGLSVNVDNGGGNGVTPVSYRQIQNSLGIANYNVENLYLYAPTYKQLGGVLSYNIYDGNGNIQNFAITSALDPYQNTTAINLDLSNYKVPVLFNGNSSVSAKVIANTSVQVTFGTTRYTNVGGLNLYNAQTLEQQTNTTLFDNYGSSISDIRNTTQTIAVTNGEAIDTTKEVKTPHPTSYAPALGFILLAGGFLLILNKSSK
jgi:hypothetical protein